MLADQESASKSDRLSEGEAPVLGAGFSQARGRAGRAIQGCEQRRSVNLPILPLEELLAIGCLIDVSVSELQPKPAASAAKRAVNSQMTIIANLNRTS